VLRQFGAEVVKTPGGIMLKAGSRLQGTKVELPYPSVGATEQVLLTAVRAEGVTELRGAAIEPEIMDLIALLQKMGAIITVDTDRVVRIEGVETLRGFIHRALPDRNETASWASAALATGGDIFVAGASQPELIRFLNSFRKIGGECDGQGSGLRCRHRGGCRRTVAPGTDVHPRLLTDWRQPLAVGLSPAEALSIIHETVYENRFGSTDALRTTGAKIQLSRECLGGTPWRFGRRNYLHSAV